MIIGISFLISLGVIVFIGAMASRVAKKETSDYLLAGRSLPPWLSAFSSAATNNSGYMFIGLVGYAYNSGIEAVWLQCGWIVGDILAWRFVHLPVRKSTGDIQALSVPSWLGTTPGEKRLGSVVFFSALLTFLFLAGYAAAQLKASSVGLSVLFGWHESVGVCLSAAIVVLYCFSGGFRASVWTDAAQSLVMIISMLLLVGTAWSVVGGLGPLWSNLAEQDPDLVRFLPDASPKAVALFLIGYVVGGMMAVGQPHILSRTMALRSVDEFTQARRFYFVWLIPFSILTLLVGLFARALLPDLTQTLGAAGAALSPEQALPILSKMLLPDVLVGVILSGLFAATMSTADSQVLTCSAAVTQDIAPRWARSYWAGKIATVSVTVLALALALVASDGVFRMVLMAWSVLGASIGPLVLLRMHGFVPRAEVGNLMMLVGSSTAFFWKFADLSGVLYEIVPGMLAAFAVLGVALLLRPKDWVWAQLATEGT